MTNLALNPNAISMPGYPLERVTLSAPAANNATVGNLASRSTASTASLVWNQFQSLGQVHAARARSGAKNGTPTASENQARLLRAAAMNGIVKTETPLLEGVL